MTGVLAVGAGIALLVLGLAIPFVHRGEGGATGARRWGYWLAVFVGGALIVYAFLFPISGAIVQTHKYREPIGAPPSNAYEPVTFTPRTDWSSRAGTALPQPRSRRARARRWGRPDRRYPTRRAPRAPRVRRPPLRLPRPRRERGKPHRVRLGLGQRRRGAIAFLRERQDVDAERIGGLGLSTGADVLIEVAAGQRDLKVVVADGATAESFADYRNLDGLDEGTPFYLTLYTAARVLSGTGPGRPLKDLVAEVAPTPLLLIATGRDVLSELGFNRIYAEAAREPVELWELPAVNHTAAVHERPRAYEQRVIGFLDQALRKATRSSSQKREPSDRP